MLRQLSATILLLAFSVQTFSNPLIMLSYYANTGEYAKNCINKARPKLHCNGKCQAMKKLQQEEKKDQQSPERKAENKAPSVFLSPDPALIFALMHAVPHQPVYKAPSIPDDRAIAVFHPPS